MEYKNEYMCPKCNVMSKKKEDGLSCCEEACSTNSKAVDSFSFLRTRVPSYYSLQQHQRKEHELEQRKPSGTVADLNKIVEEKGEDSGKLKEKLSACQHFWWIRRSKMGDNRYLTSKCPS